MKPLRTLAPLGLALAFLLAPALAADEVPGHRLMRFADIHDDHVVFTYEDDLWLVDAAGGDARRLTSGDGREYLAKFSPDGSRLAFTASYDGGIDVYVMDVRGGEPQRLTWHPMSDQVLDWHPDGQRVLFRSNRAWPNREFETYLVSIHGGMPERVPLDRGGLASISPDGADWTEYGDPQTIGMDDPVLIGLAVTSHNVNQATSAEFSNVSFDGNVSGDWQIAEIGAPAGRK